MKKIKQILPIFIILLIVIGCSTDNEPAQPPEVHASAITVSEIPYPTGTNLITADTTKDDLLTSTFGAIMYAEEEIESIIYNNGTPLTPTGSLSDLMDEVTEIMNTGSLDDLSYISGSFSESGSISASINYSDSSSSLWGPIDFSKLVLQGSLDGSFTETGDFSGTLDIFGDTETTIDELTNIAAGGTVNAKVEMAVTADGSIDMETVALSGSASALAGVSIKAGIAVDIADIASFNSDTGLVTGFAPNGKYVIDLYMSESASMNLADIESAISDLDFSLSISVYDNSDELIVGYSYSASEVEDFITINL